MRLQKKRRGLSRFKKPKYNLTNFKFKSFLRDKKRGNFEVLPYPLTPRPIYKYAMAKFKKSKSYNPLFTYMIMYLKNLVSLHFTKDTNSPKILTNKHRIVPSVSFLTFRGSFNNFNLITKVNLTFKIKKHHTVYDCSTPTNNNAPVIRPYGSIIYYISKLLNFEKLNFNNPYVFFLMDLLPRYKCTPSILSRNVNCTRYTYNTNAVVPYFKWNKILVVAKKKQKRLTRINLNNYYSLFLGTLLTNILKVHVSLTTLNLRDPLVRLTGGKFLNNLTRMFIRHHYKVGTGFFLKEAIQITLITIISKDPDIFMNYFTKKMEKVSFYKHKNYIRFFKDLFSHLYRVGLFKFGCKGVYLDIRGKIGVTGDAKKRHTLLRFGEYTFAQKAMRINTSYGLVNTFTGVLGITFSVFY